MTEQARREAEERFPNPHKGRNPRTMPKLDLVDHLATVGQQDGYAKCYEEKLIPAIAERDKVIEGLRDTATLLLAEFDDENVLAKTPIAYHRHFEALRELIAPPPLKP